MYLYDKYATINARDVYVYNFNKFVENPERYFSDDHGGIEVEGRNGRNYILPFREPTVNMEKPGVYRVGHINFLSFPTTAEEIEVYSPTDKRAVIDLTKHYEMEEYLKEKTLNNEYKNLSLEVDTTDGKTYKAPLLESDSGEMRALKESINLKEADLDKYSERFGNNYPNDKRKLKDDNITFFLLKRVCANLDIQVDLTFRDTSDKIANPMGKVVSVNLVPGLGNDVEITDA